MNQINKVVITIILLIGLSVLFFTITGQITKITGKSIIDTEKKFDECIKDKQISLYINSDNPLRTLRNLEISDYLNNINIINCKNNIKLCKDNNIKFYPTIGFNDNLYTGEISPNKLSDISGCKL